MAGVSSANPPKPAPDEALPYGLMMERRGFNFEHVTRAADGTFVVGGVRLDDAREIARKVGQMRAQRRLSRLTSAS